MFKLTNITRKDTKKYFFNSIKSKNVFLFCVFTHEMFDKK